MREKRSTNAVAGKTKVDPEMTEQGQILVWAMVLPTRVAVLNYERTKSQQNRAP